MIYQSGSGNYYPEAQKVIPKIQQLPPNYRNEDVVDDILKTLLVSNKKSCDNTNKLKHMFDKVKDTFNEVYNIAKKAIIYNIEYAIDYVTNLSSINEGYHLLAEDSQNLLQEYLDNNIIVEEEKRIMLILEEDDVIEITGNVTEFTVEL